MAVVALGTFREKAGSQHPACTISCHISKSPSVLAGSQLTHPWPAKALGRDGEEKWSGAKAGHQGPGELSGSIWDRPRRLFQHVRGAFQSREPRGCRALARCTYPAWVVPSAGARVPGIRHGADCASALCVCCSARPPGAAPERTTPSRGGRRSPPPTPIAPRHPAPARSLLPPCCVSAACDPRSGDDPGPQMSLH